MAVTLRLTGGSAGSVQTKLLTRGTLSIGRGPGNDWVLADPDRHLSKTHCVVSVENGRVVLTDLSTNGVHINGARQATARDSRTVLTDGDTFRIGNYTFAVADADSGRGGRPSSAFNDPFDPAPGPAEGGSPLDGDPLDDPFGRPPNPAFSHPVSHRPAGPPRVDPFDMAEERASRAPDPDQDLFQGNRPREEWRGPTQADNADAPDHVFTPPGVTRQDPRDIDFDALIGDLGSAPPGRGGSSPRPAPRAEMDPFADPLPSVLPPPSPAPPSPPPPPRPPAAPPVAQESPFAEPQRPAPPPAPVAPPAPAPPSGPNTADARAFLDAFLAGAGARNPLLAQADPAATMHLVGQLFRIMTEGLREVLLSRAAIKSDMRIEQTMIRANNNNALKFSVNVDDAVLALLTPDRPGYMPPVAAAKEAFADIKAHELAVMAGVQTALLNLLKRFDPAAIEQRLAQGRLADVLPGARKARYWDGFTELYAEIAREAEDDFQAAFGRHFARAYLARARRDDE